MRFATVLAMIVFAGTLSAQTIPHTEAETLTGKKIVLPDAFAHHPALIIIGFSRAGGDSAGRWGKELRKQIGENSAVQIYSIAVLQDAPRLMRGMIKHGIRGGTPKSEQERFVVLEHDEDTWKTLANFSDADSAYVFLTDSQANIRWRGHGTAPDAETVSALQSAVQKVSHPQP